MPRPMPGRGVDALYFTSILAEAKAMSFKASPTALCGWSPPQTGISKCKVAVADQHGAEGNSLTTERRCSTFFIALRPPLP